MQQPTRQRILQAVIAETQVHPEIQGLWEQGSAAMGRADELSDLDLNLLVTDGQVAAGWEVVERALRRVAPIELRYELAQPTWHGNWQAFYRLEGTSPFLLIDLCVLEVSTKSRFLEPEMHGKPIVYFDKLGWVQQAPSDPVPVAERIQQRLPTLGLTLELFSPFVRKEVMRGRVLDALHFYNNFVVPRLIEALRSRYAPWRHSFGMRYLGHDLPAELYAEVQELLFVADPSELPGKTERAVALFHQTVAEIEALDLVQWLEESR